MVSRGTLLELYIPEGNVVALYDYYCRSLEDTIL
jgi:hypothetical protein